LIKMKGQCRRRSPWAHRPTPRTQPNESREPTEAWRPSRSEGERVPGRFRLDQLHPIRVTGRRRGLAEPKLCPRRPQELNRELASCRALWADAPEFLLKTRPAPETKPVRSLARAR